MMPGGPASLPAGERTCQACRRARREPRPPRKASPTCSECHGPVNQPADRGRSRVTCSDRCKNDRDTRLKQARRSPRLLTCTACAATFEPRGKQRPRRCPDCRAAHIIGPPRECTECGQMFWPRWHSTRQCDRTACIESALTRRIRAAAAASLLSSVPSGRKPQILPGDPGYKGRRYRLEHSRPGLSRGARDLWLKRQVRRGARCFYCGRRADTHDHVVPLVRGGTNFEGNLAPACRPCNGSKGTQTIMEWRMRRLRKASRQRR